MLFLAWTQALTGTVASAVVFVLAAVALVGGVAAVSRGREGWGFLGTFIAIGLAVAGLFVALFPDVMPTTLADGASLTTTNAAATAYTLRIMTVVAVVFTPLVLAYQGWTYWVFRTPDRRPPHPPAGLGRRARMRPTDPRLRRQLAPGPRRHCSASSPPAWRPACW